MRPSDGAAPNFVRVRTSPRRGRNRFERFLFTIMGPADRGDLNAPVREQPDRPPALCSQCAQPYDVHEVVRDPGLTYTRCPSPKG